MHKPLQYLFLSVLFAGAVSVISGCGTLGLRSEQQQLFDEGMQFLHAGNQQQSYERFQQVVHAAPVAGITDEALFRLTLLQFAEECGGKGTPQTLALLERLKKEYPASPWTHQAAPLAACLSGKGSREKEREHINQLVRENRELARENRELRQNIERLKNLDFEIEQKRKR